jgi:2-C-methyl-D-erythritol 4-phosphate cytidylyltransferase / 2-C-methyl-D-erythritol 2,4-cyclodiphosphate synthase
MDYTVTDTTCLIVAAGRGERFAAALPKQYQALAGQPLLRHSLERFLAHPEVGNALVVIDPAHRSLYEAAVAGLALPDPVAGGATRQESVRLGLERLAVQAPRIVLIHDAARPLIDAATISRTIAGTREAQGAIAALPMRDSLKRAVDGQVQAGVSREGLWRAQTPQTFRFPDILRAHRAAQGEALSDDAAVADRAGLTVALVMGNEANLKVTTQADLEFAQRLLNRSNVLPRTGSGFDAHRFGPHPEGAPNSIMLCGVALPHPLGLIGHSDADVALHALTDAILGALAEGDIGVHFPPSEPRWRAAASAKFLEFAAARVKARGGQVAHVDVTIICEAPRITPYRAAMVERLAGLLGLPSDAVSVKATTTEGMGFTGRAEGIAAQAVATIYLPASPV